MKPSHEQIEVDVFDPLNYERKKISIEGIQNTKLSSTMTWKLYTSLINEKHWSSDFFVYLNFSHERPFVQISDRDFMSHTHKTLLIYEGEAETEEDVRQMVLKMIPSWESHLDFSLEILSDQKRKMGDFRLRLCMDKCAGVIQEKIGKVPKLTSFLNKSKSNRGWHLYTCEGDPVGIAYLISFENPEDIRVVSFNGSSAEDWMQDEARRQKINITEISFDDILLKAIKL